MIAFVHECDGRVAIPAACSAFRQLPKCRFAPRYSGGSDREMHVSVCPSAWRV